MTPPPPPPPPLLDDFLHQGTSFSVTINIFNFFLVLILAGVTSFSRLIWVSLVVTFAGILANGFSHGANEISLVAHGPDRNMTQGILSFMIFLVQEVGLCFYSYFILLRILRRKPRIIFQVGFWTIFTIILATRLMMVISGALGHPLNVFFDTNYGYFGGIAVLETWSACFLLRCFINARKNSAEVRKSGKTDGLLGELIRSTEVRVGFLFTVGVSRLITHAISQTTKNPTAFENALSIDDFVVFLEQIYPNIMVIDIIAARLARLTDERYNLDKRRRFQAPQTDTDQGRSFALADMKKAKINDEPPQLPADAANYSRNFSMSADAPGDADKPAVPAAVHHDEHKASLPTLYV